MPIIQEDFIRCACGCADFKEEPVLTFKKTLLPRNSKHQKLLAHETEYRYLCRDCDKELNL